MILADEKDREQFETVSGLFSFSLYRNRLKVPHSALAVLIAEYDELRALSAVDAFDLLTAICQRDIYFAGLKELCAGKFR